MRSSGNIDQRFSGGLSSHLPLPDAGQCNWLVYMLGLPPDTKIALHPTGGTPHGGKRAIGPGHATADEQHSMGRFHRQRSLYVCPGTDTASGIYWQPLMEYQVLLPVILIRYFLRSPIMTIQPGLKFQKSTDCYKVLPG